MQFSLKFDTLLSLPYRILSDLPTPSCSLPSPPSSQFYHLFLFLVTQTPFQEPMNLYQATWTRDESLAIPIMISSPLKHQVTNACTHSPTHPHTHTPHHTHTHMYLEVVYITSKVLLFCLSVYLYAREYPQTPINKHIRCPTFRVVLAVASFLNSYT